MRRMAFVAVGLLLVAGCGDSQAELVDTDVSGLRVSGEIEQDVTHFASPSPDGRHLLVKTDDEGTCVRAVDGSREVCLDAEWIDDIGGASWSPDGSRVALTEAESLGLEPDVWVFDVDTATLTNLTDDGVDSEGVINVSDDREYPDGATVDAKPSWSADGERVRFVRRESADSIALMSVSASGGEAEVVRTVDTRWEAIMAVAWAEERFAWLSGPPRDGGGSVLVADLDGDEPRTLLDGEYNVLSFSADGEYLLGDKYDLEASEPVPGAARVVPVQGGDAVPVTLGEVTYPAWGPRGHAIVYLASPGTVRVVGRPGGEPKVLHDAPRLTAASLDEIYWVRGAIVVGTGEAPVVLTLSE